MKTSRVEVTCETTSFCIATMHSLKNEGKKEVFSKISTMEIWCSKEVLAILETFRPLVSCENFWDSTYRVVMTACNWEFIIDRLIESDSAEASIVAKYIEEELETCIVGVVGLGNYHLPYVTKEEKELLRPHHCAVLSASRCHSMADLTFDDEFTYSVLDELEEFLRYKNRAALIHPMRATLSGFETILLD